MLFLSSACQYNPGEETAKRFKNISIVPKYPHPRLVNTTGKAQGVPREIKGGFEAERMILMNLGSASRRKDLSQHFRADKADRREATTSIWEMLFSVSCEMLQIDLGGFEALGCSRVS